MYISTQIKFKYNIKFLPYYLGENAYITRLVSKTTKNSEFRKAPPDQDTAQLFLQHPFFSHLSHYEFFMKKICHGVKYEIFM